MMKAYVTYVYDPCAMDITQEINPFAISHVAMSLYSIISHSVSLLSTGVLQLSVRNKIFSTLC